MIDKRTVEIRLPERQYALLVDEARREGQTPGQRARDMVEAAIGGGALGSSAGDRTELETAQAQLTAAAQTERMLRGQIADLQRAAAKAPVAAPADDGAVAALRQQLRDAKVEIARLVVARDAAEADLRRANGQLAAAKDMIAAGDAREKRLKGELSEALCDQLRLVERTRKAEVQAGASHTALLDAQTEARQWRETLDRTNDDVAQLRTRLSDMEATAQRGLSRLADMAAQRAASRDFAQHGKLTEMPVSDDAAPALDAADTALVRAYRAAGNSPAEIAKRMGQPVAAIRQCLGVK